MSDSAEPYPEQLAELLDDLTLLADRNDRIDFLISIADRFREVPVVVARRPFAEAHKVPACESDAYAWAVPRSDGTLDFHFAVENPQGISAMAMAAILSQEVSGAPLDQVAVLDAEVVYQIFGRELSMGKSMGLMGMVSMVAHFARQRLGEGREASTAEPASAG